MTTIFIDDEPVTIEGPPGLFIPLKMYDALQAQLAALTAERDALREVLTDLLAWANIQDHHSAQAVSIRGRAWAVLNQTPEKETK